jgi:hypothetical protein
MKKLLLVLSALIFYCDATAQLKADAGIDTVWCSPNSSSFGPTIGGRPTASQGTPPYTYLWKMVNWPNNATLLLDDVTSDHPTLVKQTVTRIDSAFFEVLITDANGQKARDTVRVYFTYWICPLGENVKYKNSSDTIRLNYWQCGSLFYPNTFMYWSPAPYLDDSTVASPRCWTPHSQEYTAFYQNSIGCVMKALCNVEVYSAGIESQNLSGDDVFIFPNPITTQSKIVCTKEWLGGTMSVSSVDGRILEDMRITKLATSLALWSIEPPGVYFYRVASLKGEMKSGKFIIE